MQDGFIKSKGKRLPCPEEKNEFKILLQNLKAFIHNTNFTFPDVPEFWKLSPIDFSDPLLELVPEAYLDGKTPTMEELQDGVNRLVRENAALIIRYGREKN